MNEKPNLSELVTILDDDQAIIHYGVLGMKWGVRKTRGGKAGEYIAKRTKKNQRLEAKASKADKKAADLRQKVVDQRRRGSIKTQKMESKAAVMESKKDKAYYKYAMSGGSKGSQLKKSMRYQMAATKYLAKAEKIRLNEAKLLNRAANYEEKAAKYRKTIEQNKHFIGSMNAYMSVLPKEERELGQMVIDQMLKKK